MNFFLMFYLFLRQRETEHECRWGRERGGDTESEAGSRLWAVSTEPRLGLEITNREIMTWAEVGCSTDRAPWAPRKTGLLKAAKDKSAQLLPQKNIFFNFHGCLLYESSFKIIQKRDGRLGGSLS